VPVSVLWFYSRAVMTGLGQNPALAEKASQYLQILIPSLWAYAGGACVQNWLHAQGKTRAVAAVTLAVALLHPLWCYTYVFVWGYGYLGAAYAIVTSKFTELTLLLAYTGLGRVGQETGFTWSWAGATSEWWPFLR